MKRAVAVVLIALASVGWAAPAQAYLKFGVRVGASTVNVKWNNSLARYFVTERATPEIPVPELVAAIGRAFATWQAVPSASIRAEYQGLTSAPPVLSDGRATLGFLDRPELERVLAATSFLIDMSTGEILESDIFFNTRFTWSTAAAGVAGRVDLESVAVHEVGHLLGLGHSAIGETEVLATGGRRVLGSGAVMFPIAFTSGAIADRQLQADDIAGISDIYPDGDFLQRTGSVSGHVRKDGRGVFGAHVVAFNLDTGQLVGNFTLDDQGEFVIAGLDAGRYVLRAEPIDDADLDGFFAGPIDVSFRVGYAARLAVVQSGGGTDPIEIVVRPK